MFCWSKHTTPMVISCPSSPDEITTYKSSDTTSDIINTHIHVIACFRAYDSTNTFKLGAYSRWRVLPYLNVLVQKSDWNHQESTKRWLSELELLRRTASPWSSPTSRYCSDTKRNQSLMLHIRWQLHNKIMPKYRKWHLELCFGCRSSDSTCRAANSN